MRITALCENTACDRRLGAEHGLSLFIETREHTVLFDAGASGLFAENAAKLGIDLAKADAAVLSHGHYDHSGGFLKFFEINKRAPVYMNRNAAGKFFNRAGKFIGTDERVYKSERIIMTGDSRQIFPELDLRTCNEREPRFPAGGGGLKVRADGADVPDDFRHEQYLLIREDGKRVAVSGCSHKGVLNVVEWLRPDVLVGGFHLKDVPDTPEGRRMAEATARDLLKSGAVFYTCHCTGVFWYEYMKEIMGDRLEYLAGGRTIEI